MSLLIKISTSIGLLFLIHGIYSAYEHSLLPARAASSNSGSTPSTPTRAPLPTDIALETLVGTFLLLVSIVYSASPLRPIQWAEWAGKIEREGWNPSTAGTEHERRPEDGKGGAGNPYRALEERRGFWDVRGARAQFADWVREGHENGSAGALK